VQFLAEYRADAPAWHRWRSRFPVSRGPAAPSFSMMW